MGPSHAFSACCRDISGVDGQLLEASSSEVILPSKEGAEVVFGTRRLRSWKCARTAGESCTWNGGESGVVADLSFWIVGHWLGDGITIDG